MTNAHITQPRRPPGSADAGQWTSRYRGESEADLGDWTANGGSYDYPPYLPQADDATRFWLKEVQIPEEVLKRVDEAYAMARINEAQAAVDAWERSGEMTSFRGEARDEERRRVARSGLGSRPRRIPKVLIRPLTRVASLHFYTQDTLDERARDEICNQTTFDLPGQRPMTPAQIVAAYDLDSIREAFEDGESEEVLEVRRLRVDLSEEITALRNDLLAVE